MGRANSKKIKDYLRVSQFKEKKKNNEITEQYHEALAIQNKFGIYRDQQVVVGERVNLMTPAEVTYYLGITFNGVLLSAIPDTVERALVLENNLTYAYTVNASYEEDDEPLP